MFGCLRVVVSAVALLILVIAYWSGEWPRMLVFALPALVIAFLPCRLWGALRGQVYYGFAFRFWRAAYRNHLWQWFNRTTCYLLIASCETLSIPPAVLTPDEYSFVMLMIWSSAGILIGMELMPPKRLGTLFNMLVFCFTAFLGVQLLSALLFPMWTEKVVLQSPVRGEWLVLQGGRSSLFNHHFAHPGQRHALDLVKCQDGVDKHGAGDTLAAYATFGQPLLAPAAGTIVSVVDYRRDEPIGASDGYMPLGNHVIIDIGESEFVLMAHMLRGSIRVRKGQLVKVGQFVGRCGNSGNTTLPHLHIQVQNKPDWQNPELRTYPMYFEHARHLRWGIEWPKQQGELVRNDRMRGNR